MIHIPVLQKKVLEYLNPKLNENFIDCTVSLGGHTIAILEKNKPKGKVLGIEVDPEIYKELKSEKASFSNRLILVNDSFTNLKKIVKQEKFSRISGILFDLGMSSWHLEKSERGFSFLRNEPLDMRYGLKTPLTAEKIVNYWSKFEIERILNIYGEERYSNQIAKEIIEARRKKSIKTTSQLVRIIKRAVPKRYSRGRIHLATRTFQALRITVNDELNNLEKVLPQTLEILKKEGRLVIISFHSLEDRIIKNFFRNQTKKGCLKTLIKKPIRPTIKEIKNNPRSRSARLRAAIKITINN